MTKLDKQFFNTFEIKPKYTYLVTDMFYTSNSHNYGVTKNDLIEYFGSKNCGRYKVTKVYKTYPQITDRILLELICIHNQYSHPFSIYGEKKEFLKNDILECMINMLNYFYEHEIGEYSELKQQVRTLFKEER